MPCSQFLKLLVTALLLVLTGCVYVPHAEIEQSRRMQYVEAHPDLLPAIRDNILKGFISTGMTPADVAASWGKPTSTSESSGLGGSSATWWYGNYGEGRVVLIRFESGKVVRWTNSDY